jgi:hypothetical protein
MFFQAYHSVSLSVLKKNRKECLLRQQRCLLDIKRIKRSILDSVSIRSEWLLSHPFIFVFVSSSASFLVNPADQGMFPIQETKSRVIPLWLCRQSKQEAKISRHQHLLDLKKLEGIDPNSLINFGRNCSTWNDCFDRCSNSMSQKPKAVNHNLPFLLGTVERAQNGGY